MPPPRWTARGKPSVHSKASAREVQRFFSLFPKDEVEDEVVEATPPPPPRSTAPPRLQREDAQEQGRGNRKRVPTISCAANGDKLAYVQNLRFPHQNCLTDA
jgi:hypothetical protein